MNKKPKAPVPMWGGLNQRLHAIKVARQWQLANANSRNPSTYAAYCAIVDLLIALKVTQKDLDAIAKSEKGPRS